MEIIPAIDIMNGKCIRLKQGQPSRQKIYSDNPLKVAEKFANEGAERIHIVDIDAALGRKTNTTIITKLTKELTLKIQLAGGIRTVNQAEEVISLGVDRIVFGTIAVIDPTVVSEANKKLGTESIAVAIDEKDNRVAIKGWKELTSTNYLDFALEQERLGISTIILTSISRDGMLQGPALDKIVTLKKRIDASLIVSGGISNLTDIYKLADIGVTGVIIGTAFYENKLSFREALEVSKSVN